MAPLQAALELKWQGDFVERLSRCLTSAVALAAGPAVAGLEGRKVSCDLKDAPAPGPTFALCEIDGQDLSAAMADAGTTGATSEPTPMMAVATRQAALSSDLTSRL